MLRSVFSRMRREPALRVLLELYNQRTDLLEAFPEVRAGDFRRLIDWAAAAAKQGQDSSSETLLPYAGWYTRNYSGTPPPATIPWDTLEQTSRKSANPMPVTLSSMRDESDISQHLVTLSMLVTEFDLKQIVELGTRDGCSTLAFLEAAQQIGGSVLSIDIEPCTETKRKVADAGLAHLWSFLQANDLEVDPSQIPRAIDLLFIDTNHVYSQAIAELQKYRVHLRDGSWIALHDCVAFHGVSRAVKEFVESLPQRPRFYPFVHQNGLALIRT